MIEITFNAFSFLQKKLRHKNRPFADVSMSLPEGATLFAVIDAGGIADGRCGSGVFKRSNISAEFRVKSRGSGGLGASRHTGTVPGHARHGSP